jgi:hypothetical protein
LLLAPTPPLPLSPLSRSIFSFRPGLRFFINFHRMFFFKQKYKK